MDLFKSVAGAIGAAQDGSGAGGLGELVARFQQAGLGDVVASWISTGPNLPISAEQIQAVLGSDMVARLASQFGLNAGDGAGPLSTLLPQLIDQLTPNGELPAAGAGGGLGALSGLAGLAGSLLKR